MKIEFPRPISTNSLYANVRGKGRVKSKDYNTWIWHVTAKLQKQKPLPKFTEPVRITLAVGTVGVSPNMDGDNCVKAVFDQLVAHGVIPDDNRKWVRGHGVEWVEGKEGMTVHVQPADAFYSETVDLRGQIW